MSRDETSIRALIEAWAAAPHHGDIDSVLAHHDPDIVMYDVPPPENGVRGVAADRETWPGFFQWQKGATFDLLSLEILAGEELASFVRPDHEPGSPSVPGPLRPRLPLCARVDACTLLQVVAARGEPTERVERGRGAGLTPRVRP